MFSDRSALALQVKAMAVNLGFGPVGITSAAPFDDAREVALQRLGLGLMDGLPWFHEARVRRGTDPQQLLPGAVSIIALALSYGSTASPEPPAGTPRGRISRYAWGRDYHKVIEQRVKDLLKQLETLSRGRALFYVDYGPMLDRAVSARAGIGWYGKNTNLLTRGKGSWVFLAEVLTTLELEPDQSLKKSCGSCTACIPACPTGAIIAPYVLDNTRCISYHTIENKGTIPRDLRKHFGDWVFGCDLCQDVCPVNDRLTQAGDAAFAAHTADDAYPELDALLDLTEAQFRASYQDRAVQRAGLAGLQRNACIALGNSKLPEAATPLVKALKSAYPVVRGHAAWALGRIGGNVAEAALQHISANDGDPHVREEARLALAEAKHTAAPA